MNRITNKQLEAVVKKINIITKSPEETYIKTKEKFNAQIGNYHLSFAYGGAALHRIVNDAGGCEDVLRSGHVSKKCLYNLMQAFIYGITTLDESKIVSRRVQINNEF